jgi:putative NIF3 family GTP cyclohydrolase 1 type 2
MNSIFAGHYATEKFGVQAVGELIRRRFGLPVAFVDMGIEY